MTLRHRDPGDEHDPTRLSAAVKHGTMPSTHSPDGVLQLWYCHVYLAGVCLGTAIVHADRVAGPAGAAALLLRRELAKEAAS